MPRRVDHLLIGGGIASAMCARTLREEGAQGSVLVVGRELDPPYHRPPISKEYLRGEQGREQGLVVPAGWWEERQVELQTRTSVMALDLDARVARLSNREEVGFDQALVATGAMVRRLAVEGAELDGIHYLRTLGTADSLRRDLEGVEQVLLVGGSYIGCEVAASLTELGKRCTIVMQESVTLERGFGTQAGRHLQDVLEQHGIEVIAAEEVERFDGGEAAGDGEVARVSGAVTRSGRELDAQAVVAGVGAIPDTMLAQRAGLRIGELGGVRTDDRLRSSAAGVFAAGDMCEYDSPVHGRVLRIEHEEVAAAQGRTAALNMLGHDRPHDAVPYFFSDLSDWVSLEYLGPAERWDSEIVRGSLDDGRFSIFYVNEGRLVATLCVGRSEDLEVARTLIARGAPVGDHVSALQDPDTDLAGLR